MLKLKKIRSFVSVILAISLLSPLFSSTANAAGDDDVLHQVHNFIPFHEQTQRGGTNIFYQQANLYYNRPQLSFYDQLSRGLNTVYMVIFIGSTVSNAFHTIKNKILGDRPKLSWDLPYLDIYECDEEGVVVCARELEESILDLGGNPPMCKPDEAFVTYHLSRDGKVVPGLTVHCCVSSKDDRSVDLLCEQTGRKSYNHNVYETSSRILLDPIKEAADGSAEPSIEIKKPSNHISWQNPKLKIVGCRNERLPIGVYYRGCVKESGDQVIDLSQENKHSFTGPGFVTYQMVDENGRILLGEVVNCSVEKLSPNVDLICEQVRRRSSREYVNGKRYRLVTKDNQDNLHDDDSFEDYLVNFDTDLLEGFLMDHNNLFGEGDGYGYSDIVASDKGNDSGKRDDIDNYINENF